MKNNKFLLAATFILSATIYSCKKDSQSLLQEDAAAKIIKISNTSSSNRIDLANEGLTLNFENSVGGGLGTLGTNAPLPEFPFQLVYKGKVNPQIGANNKALSALEVSDYGNYYAIAYQTPGDKFGGGVDVIDMQSGTPIVSASVSTPDADITCITTGGSRLWLGMDLKTYEHFDYPAPAVIGVVKIHGGSLEEPQVVGLEGYSTKDVQYDIGYGKVYAASGTNGGVSVISVVNDKATRTAFQPYGGARSVTVNYGKVIATNGYSYAEFDYNTAAESNYKHWPIRSDEVSIGRVSALWNGNYIFGNNYALVYVNSVNSELIDEVEVGGWINSISVMGDRMYISTGNSLIVATIENNKIKILAKTHFASVFGGNFNVISAKVTTGGYVFVACGDRGTYVFDLTKS